MAISNKEVGFGFLLNIGLLIKGVNKTMNSKRNKITKRWVCNMLLGKLAASKPANLFAGKGVIQADERVAAKCRGCKANIRGQGMIREGQDFWCHLIL